MTPSPPAAATAPARPCTRRSSSGRTARLMIQYVSPLLSDVVPFLVLLAMLVLRPWGLLGQPER